MNVGNVRHEFCRVSEGTPVQHVTLRSTVLIDGVEYHSEVAFPFTESEYIMEQLDACEELLARTIGRKIVKGISP